MGQDKAGVLIDGQCLWERQLETLRRTGPKELIISGDPNGPYAKSGVRIVTDDQIGMGPLAGIAAALGKSDSPYLLVLAIDLPKMRHDFLRALVEAASVENKGIVPQKAAWFEPMGAVYTRACLPLIGQHLKMIDRSMQCFVRDAIVQGLLLPRPLSEAEEVFFTNINTPTDL